MSLVIDGYVPLPSLLEEPPDPLCRICVTVPVRNEQGSLARCLDAMVSQVDLEGKPLPCASLEILLLLNNCTDGSAACAHAWAQEHAAVRVHVLEKVFAPAEAHVGTARRWLMDTAWHRLQHVAATVDGPLGPLAILATDADSVVAPDWIAQNLRALTEGADVVGGCVGLLTDDLRGLPSAVRVRYERDRRYAALIAQLEDVLDPQQGDRCPRHLDHFGASLACTPAAYAAAGGMPAVSPLEDEAFVDRVRRANGQLRHDPRVRVFTSARMEGRAAVGMAGQLRLWHQLESDEAHLVTSAAYLVHRFRMLHSLRQVFARKNADALALPTDWWRETFAEALRSETTCPGFLAAVYCDILIAEAFEGARQQPILLALRDLEAFLQGSGIEAEAVRGDLGRVQASAQRSSEGMLAPATVLAGSLQ